MIETKSISDLIQLLNITDETEQLEAKNISQNVVGKSIYETISALCNEPDLGGGTILLGVEKEENSLFPNYLVSGVTDPDKVTSDIGSACGTMFNIPIRPTISSELVNQKIVVRIDVDEVPANQKPVYIKSRHLPSGAYRRSGPTDVKCTDEDIQIFFQGKSNDPYDKRIVKDARWDDIEPLAIAAYRKARREANPAAEEINWSDTEMLHALGAITQFDGKIQITNTGLIAFGKSSAIRRLLPTMRVDYVRVPGKGWVEDPDKFLDSLEIRGPTITIISRIIAAIVDDLPKTLVVEDSSSGQRTETPVLPIRVIREAVVNALMHRSYEVFQPIQIIRYANRIEIRNPGYSLKSQERFSEPGSEIRNPTIAEILHETRFAENKGSGIRVMQQKMQTSGLSAPTFESDREGRQFTATFLFHHFLDETDWDWLKQFSNFQLSDDQRKALIFVREIGAIDNSAFRSLTQVDTLTASKSLKSLVQLDLLRMRGSGTKVHYVAGEAFLNFTNMDGSAASIHAKPANMDANAGSAIFEAIPTPLRFSVKSLHLQRRANPDEVRKIILQLCDWRELSLTEIARYISKTDSYVQQKYVTPMVSEGLLCYKFPEMIKHPNQKYQSKKLSERG